MGNDETEKMSMNSMAAGEGAAGAGAGAKKMSSPPYFEYVAPSL